MMLMRPAGRALFRFVVAGQVAANRGPAHAGVGSFEDGFASVINGAGFVGGNHDRRGPLEAMDKISIASAHGVEGPGRDVLDLVIFFVEARD